MTTLQEIQASSARARSIYLASVDRLRQIDPTLEAALLDHNAATDATKYFDVRTDTNRWKYYSTTTYGIALQKNRPPVYRDVQLKLAFGRSPYQTEAADLLRGIQITYYILSSLTCAQLKVISKPDLVAHINRHPNAALHIIPSTVGSTFGNTRAQFLSLDVPSITRDAQQCMQRQYQGNPRSNLVAVLTCGFSRVMQLYESLFESPSDMAIILGPCNDEESERAFAEYMAQRTTKMGGRGSKVFLGQSYGLYALEQDFNPATDIIVFNDGRVPGALAALFPTGNHLTDILPYVNEKSLVLYKVLLAMAKSSHSYSSELVRHIVRQLLGDNGRVHRVGYGIRRGTWRVVATYTFEQLSTHLSGAPNDRGWVYRHYQTLGNGAAHQS